ncbi:uncharacterized protein LOC144083843 isoform X2 [Stigmatopora argus]
MEEEDGKACRRRTAEILRPVPQVFERLAEEKLLSVNHIPADDTSPLLVDFVEAYLLDSFGLGSTDLLSGFRGVLICSIISKTFSWSFRSKTMGRFQSYLTFAE